MTGRLTLANARFDLELDPAVGGAVTGFRLVRREATEPILRDVAADLSDAVNASAFPLVPFCNRIRNGRFEFRGREVVLEPNMAPDPSPLHGQGWRNPWRVDKAEAAAADLAYDHPPGEWPWAYETRQAFRLDDNGLAYVLTVKNLSEEPMPAGLGWHPYFPSNGETVLDAKVKDVWTVDKHVLPVDRVPATGRYDLAQRHIDGADLDNGFGGWSGEAVIHWPDRSIRARLTSPQARFFQVYAPKAGGVFVAEPVTHANAALNAPESEWPALGLRVLRCGETLQLDARIDVEG
jgi:aldose 1-epimerase